MNKYAQKQSSNTSSSLTLKPISTFKPSEPIPGSFLKFSEQTLSLGAFSVKDVTLNKIGRDLELMERKLRNLEKANKENHSEFVKKMVRNQSSYRQIMKRQFKDLSIKDGN